MIGLVKIHVKIDIETNKLKKLRKIIDDNDLDIRLEIDGGVNLDNISEISQAGADTFVAGSAIFSEKDYRKIISDMRNSLK